MAQRFINTVRDKVKDLLSKIPSGKAVKFEANEIPGTSNTTVRLGIGIQFQISKDVANIDVALFENMLITLSGLKTLAELLGDQLIELHHQPNGDETE